MTASTARLRWLLPLGYVLLVVYGTLFPLTGWQLPGAGHMPFQAPIARDISMPDVLANVLLYMPIGFLFLIGRRRARTIPAVLVGALVLSMVLETLQAFLPGRVSSALDTMLNVLGTGMGLAVAYVVRLPDVADGPDWWVKLRSDHVAWLGVAGLLAWVCAQLIPFVPSLDVSNIKAGLKPLWYALQGQSPVSLWRFLVYVAATASLTIIGARVFRIWRWGGISALILLAVLPLKVLVIGRQLSPEAFTGTLLGVSLGVVLWVINSRGALLSALILMLCYIVGEALQPGAAGTVTHAFNWIPLHAQLIHPISGLANLADTVWPVLVLACLCTSLGARRLWLYLPPLALLLIGVEWAQHWIPGRYPGITPILFGVGTWVAAAIWARQATTS